MPKPTFDAFDRKLMNVLQSDFPMVETPFSHIGSQLGVPEAEVIARVRALKRRNVVRQIGAIFDTRRLGYKSTLVAMRFSPEMLHRGAQVISGHPGVSHNYAREGGFNLWFTLAVPPGHSVGAEVDMLARAAGAEATRLLPTVRFFKIGVNFDMEREVSDARKYFVPDLPDGHVKNGRAGGTAGSPGEGGHPGEGERPGEGWNQPQPLSERDIAVIRELQEDIPLESRPFDGKASRLGMAVPELFAYAQGLVERRLMRRYSAVLHHRRAGFAANAMIVWKVPEERAQDVGELMAESPWVTHCYQRPTYGDWPYTHFTMIHATSRAKCDEVAKEIEAATGIHDRLLLYSTREYKKTRVRYFVEDEFKAPAAAADAR